MSGLPWVKNDGGRSAAGYRGTAGDCVVRAIAIAAERPYVQVYSDLHQLMKQVPKKRGRRSPREGVPRAVFRHYMESLGWRWTPVMGIGTGCQMHLAPGEVPDGRLVVSLSRHLAAVIDGVVHDTHDPSRDGTRCVYGYWSQ